MELAALVFWLCAGLLGWVYVGYPALAALVARVRAFDTVPTLPWPSRVTVGVAVHNGAMALAERVANIRGQAAPFDIDVIVASDGSTDDTVAVARGLAATHANVRVLELARVGQSAAQAEIFGATDSEIVVLTDVDSRFAPGCVEALVEALRDERVGCATGVLRWSYDTGSDTATHEGAYWRYEQQIRAWESAAGWLSAGTGALLAVRRSIFSSVPAHASLDQMLPLLARKQGLMVVVTPAAGGSDMGLTSVGDQFRSRVRIATQGIEANLRMVLRIAPWRAPGAWLAIWSHKLLRWASPFLVVGSAICAAVLAAGGHAFYLAVLVAMAIGLLLAAVGYIAKGRQVRVPLSGFALTLATINIAFALGWLNVLTRRRVSSWGA